MHRRLIGVAFYESKTSTGMVLSCHGPEGWPNNSFQPYATAGATRLPPLTGGADEVRSR